MQRAQSATLIKLLGVLDSTLLNLGPILHIKRADSRLYNEAGSLYINIYACRERCGQPHQVAGGAGLHIAACAQILTFDDKTGRYHVLRHMLSFL